MNLLYGSLSLSIICLALFWVSPALGQDTPDLAVQNSKSTGIDSSKNAVKTESAKKVVFLGDSLTEGHGVAAHEAFPALIETRLKENGYENIEVINAGSSGSTSASAASRLKWLLKGQPDVVVIALGANDGLRGIPPKETRKNLSAAIEEARKAGAKVLLAGMELPPNYGTQFADEFKRLYPELAKKYDIPLVPFLLEGVGGEISLNLPDQIHPNADGHKRIAETVYPYLKGLL